MLVQLLQEQLWSQMAGLLQTAAPNNKKLVPLKNERFIFLRHFVCRNFDFESNHESIFFNIKFLPKLNIERFDSFEK